MKRLVILFSVLALLIGTETKAQNIEVGGSFGYLLSGPIRHINGDALIMDNPSYGGFIHTEISRNLKLELMYIRSDSEVRYSTLLSGTNLYSMSTEYYHIGGMSLFGDHERIKPFTSFTLGATRFHLKENLGYYDAWKFSIAPSLGVKIYITDRIGIQGRARLLMPLTFDGLGFWWSTSGGTQAAISMSVPVWQGDFSGGIFIRL